MTDGRKTSSVAFCATVVVGAGLLFPLLMGSAPHLPLGLNALGWLAVPLALVSVGLIGLMLAQIKKQPRIYFPYIFLAAVACSVLVDLTGLISLEREAALFLPLLIVLSVASFAEYHAREVHKSHLWTAACTGIITISYWILTAFTMGVASV